MKPVGRSARVVDLAALINSQVLIFFHLEVEVSRVQTIPIVRIGIHEPRQPVCPVRGWPEERPKYIKSPVNSGLYAVASPDI